MSLRWRSPVPKGRRNEKETEAALKLIIYPIAITAGLLGLKIKKKKSCKKRKRIW